MRALVNKNHCYVPVVATSSTKKEYCVRKYCLSSKAALLVLMWNFSVLLVDKELVDVKNSIMEVIYVAKSPRILVVGHSVIHSCALSTSWTVNRHEVESSQDTSLLILHYSGKVRSCFPCDFWIWSPVAFQTSCA